MITRARIVRLAALAGIVAGLAGCASTEQWAEWRSHSSHFASGNHLVFSVTHRGEAPTRSVTSRDFDRAQRESWWGDPLVVPAEQVVQVAPEKR